MSQKNIHSKPPRFGEWLLRSFCSYDYLNTALADMEEIYHNNMQVRGRLIAQLLYVKEALGVVYHLYFKGKSQFSSNRTAMLKNNFIISIRNFKKDKVYSLLNTLGLTLGLSTFILISLFINQELSYDKFHEDYESIYRLSHERVEEPGTYEFAKTISASIAPLLKENIPEIQAYTRIGVRGQTIVKSGDRTFYESGVYAVEASFFDFFNFEIASGNLQKALNDPKAIMITESMARKYFETSDPLGKILTINKRDLREVVAVVKDPPRNTQFQFNFLMSFEDKKTPEMTWSRTAGYAFFKIDPAHVPAVLVKIDTLKNSSFPPNYGDKRAKSRNLLPSRFNLQALADIHLKSRIQSEVTSSGDIRYIYTFSLVGLIVLIIACVNYTNSAMARSIKRAKEVGIRKVVGAGKGALVRLYLTETFLYVMASVVLSGIVVYWALPYYNQLIDKQLSFSEVSTQFVLSIVGVVLAVTFLSGIYPATFLSKMTIVNTLKGKSQSRRGSRFKKALITFQFLIAQVLIIVTIIIQSQLGYLQNKDIGYDREQLIYIPTKGELKKDYAVFKNEINALPQVLNSAYALNLLASGDMTAFPRNTFEGHEDDTDENFWANYYGVAENFIETMGMEIIKGRDFENGGAKGYIINETLARKLDWENPIGKVVTPAPYGTTVFPPISIIGVVKDFNDQSLKAEIKPMMMSISPDSLTNSYLLARLSPQNMSSTIGAIENIWDKYVADRPFDFAFYDEKFNKQYNVDLRMGRIFWALTIMAIVISVLGIIGLSSFMVEQRMKEFSIRKVLGATIQQLISIVNKSFLFPIILAFVVGAPLAYYWTSEQWLQSFVYRIDIQVWYFVSALAGTLLLTFMTIGYHALKLKKSNPTTYLGSD